MQTSSSCNILKNNTNVNIQENILFCIPLHQDFEFDLKIIALLPCCMCGSTKMSFFIKTK